MKRVNLFFLFIISLFIGGGRVLAAETLLTTTKVTVYSDSTVNSITNSYGSSPKITTPSASGGKMYTWYTGDFENLIYLETDSSNRIIAYGAIEGNFSTSTYKYGDKITDPGGKYQGILSHTSYNTSAVGILKYRTELLTKDFVQEYLETYDKDESLYASYVGEHAVAYANALERIDGNTIRLKFSEEYFHKYWKIKETIGLSTYGEKTNKKSYYIEYNSYSTGSSSWYDELIDDLPNPISAAQAAQSRSPRAGIDYGVLYYGVYTDDYGYYRGYNTGGYVSANFFKMSTVVPLEPNEEILYQMGLSKYNYSLDIYNGGGQTTYFEIEPQYTIAPLTAGKIYDNFLEGTAEYLNAIRVSAGLPAIEHDPAISNAAQHKATLVGYYLDKGVNVSHYPPKPTGVSDSFYNTAQSYMNENLYGGSLVDSIPKALNDISGDPVTAGHRYNLLNPAATAYGFGTVDLGGFQQQSVHKYNIGGSYSNQIVAWPSKGITPMEAWYDNCYWTFKTYKDYTVDSETSVEITRLNDGQTWTFNTSDAQTTNHKYVVTGSSLLSFYDTGLIGQDGFVYEIKVKNIIKNGNRREYTYRSVFKSFFSKIDYVLPKSISFDKSTYDVNLGKRLHLNVTFNEGTTEQLTSWESSDPSVAIVNDYGDVIPLKIGKTTIKVTTINGVTTTCIINVTQPSISINLPTLRFNNYDYSQQLTTKLSNGWEHTVTWSSENENIAMVDQNGNVTSKSSGFTYINGVSQYGNVKSLVYVEYKIPLPNGGYGYIGDLDGNGSFDTADYNLILNIINNDTSNQDYKKLADLDGDGYVTNKDASIIRWVIDNTKWGPGEYYPIKSLYFQSSTDSIPIGRTYKFVASYTPSYSTEAFHVLYSSTNTSVVTVDQNGVATAVGVGTSTIKACTPKDICVEKEVTVPEVKITSIHLGFVGLKKEKGDTYQLKPEAYPTNATETVTYTYSSEDSEIAPVSSTGLITFKNYGTTTITVTASNGMTASIQVTVNERPITYVGFSQSPCNVTVGEKYQPRYLYSPDNTTDDISKVVKFRVEDTTYATVDSNGVVTGIKAGNTKLYIEANGYSSYVSLIVKDIVMTSFKIDNSNNGLLNMVVGGIHKITPSYEPSNTTEDKTITYSSSDKSVATVDSEGNIKALKAGNTVITAVCGRFTSYLSVKVSSAITKPITSVSLNKTSLTIIKGNNETLTATINPSDTDDNKTLTWTSSNTSVATVSNGKVTAVGKGTSIITVKTSNGKSATCTVTVNDVIDITSISLNKTTLSIVKGSSETLTATISPSNANVDKTLTWLTSNNAIANVDNNGKVTGMAKGTTTITVRTSNGKTATCTVTVTEPIVEISSVSLNKTSLTLMKGATENLTATINPSNTTIDKTLTWTSSNTSVATITNGKVTAVSKGTATITVKTSNGKTAICTVTVNEETISEPPSPSIEIPVYRLYNKSTGEHLYTTDANEKEVLYTKHGWGYEGIGWYTTNSGKPIYRLYNPGLGNHLYTSDDNEIEVLTTSFGWRKDNNGLPVMYSSGTIPVYRVYNKGLRGMHHLTTNEEEYNKLPEFGWKQEGISMLVYKIGNQLDKTDYYKQ